MKNFKKLLCLILVLTLSIGCTGVTAFATENAIIEKSIVADQFDIYEEPTISNHEQVKPLAEDDIIIYQISEENWSPSMGAFGNNSKRAAQRSGTLRIALAAACRDPRGTHTNEKVNFKVISGLVTLVSVDIPVDGKIHVYRFNGVDNKKVNIVKGNNYTTKITGSSNCLLMAISGYTGVE